MKMKISPWPLGITIYYASFVLLVIFFAINASGLRFDLVTDDYYAQELKHEERMAAKQRAAKLESKPMINLENDLLRVDVPQALADRIAENGFVNIYRASDKRQDVLADWNPRESFSTSLQGKLPGRYEVQLSWKINEQHYYLAEEIFLETL